MGAIHSARRVKWSGAGRKRKRLKEYHLAWNRANRAKKRAHDRRYREKKRAKDPQGYRERKRVQDRRYRERKCEDAEYRERRRANDRHYRKRKRARRSEASLEETEA
jgi:hypothetical protein